MLTNETLATIKNRRSIRNFKNEQITDAELQVVLDAGSYAPSANEQAWHFTVIRNKELLTRLNRDAKEFAKQMEFLQMLANDESFNIFYNAPTVILMSGDENGIAIESDCAAATQNMLLAAESIGLGSCWIGFVLVLFNTEAKEYLKELGVPDGYKPYASVALGYKTKAETSAPPPRKRNLVNYIR